MTPLRDAVASGGVSLDPSAGELLGKALAARLDQADDWIKRLPELSRRAPLGMHPVGTALTGKFEGLATSSLEAVLTAYREVLRQTRAAVMQAIRDLTEADAAQHDAFRRIEESS